MPRDGETAALVVRIIRAHPEGVTGARLLEEMLRAAQLQDHPLYLGPGITLREFLDHLSLEGRVYLSGGSVGLKIQPTSLLLNS
jgi:hypothetical protein